MAVAVVVRSHHVLVLAGGEGGEHRVGKHLEATVARHEQGEHRYAAILKNLLSSRQSNIAQRKRELNKYRTVHHIDNEHHREALKECGWTEEEFEAGHKVNEAPGGGSHSNTPEHGPEWYIRQIIFRLVG